MKEMEYNYFYGPSSFLFLIAMVFVKDRTMALLKRICGMVSALS
tara:strand:+ start:847 stop:978 length:132 start_codon:yes stop_codon:yes gene_type:complete